MDRGDSVRVLLIDTCGEVGSLALANGENIVASHELPARGASSALLGSIRTLMREASWELQTLEAVGVVSGPGSFTGVRAGLAAAKGLCEGLGLPIAAVSRLEVLAEAAGLQQGYAVLNAGRSELYVRRVVHRALAEEALYSISDLLNAVQGERVVAAEERLVEAFSAAHPELLPLSAASALPAVMRNLSAGGDDLERIDANYVRSEHQIYGKARDAANA